MAPSAALVSLLVAAFSAAPVTAGDSYTVFAASKSGLMHLDSNGTLLAWRPDTNQTGQLATNPRNGTVCWIRRVRDPGLGDAVRHAVRCAELAHLNQTWDLPFPLSFTVSRVVAFAFDRLTDNWYFTLDESMHLLRKDGTLHHDAYRSYVCNYLFDKCLQLFEDVPGIFANIRVAYDFANGLRSYTTVENRFTNRLKLARLDGSVVRTMDTHIRDPHDLAMDPVGRRIYWLDRSTIYGNFTDLNSIDYDGKNKARVRRINAYKHIRAIDAVDGTVVVIREDKSVISVVNGDTGEMIDLVSGVVKGGETIPALANPEDLLAVSIVSLDTQPETEDVCYTAGCQDFCIPVVADNTPAATCACAEGLQLVDLECRKEHPSFAMLVGATSLQAVDLRTEQAAIILSNLTNGTRVDVYRVSDAEFLLFWLDAGSLNRGRWSPGGLVTDVQLLVSAAKDAPVVEVAVYASQHQLFWMTRDESDASAGSRMVVQMSPLDHSYVKTVLVSKWEDQQDKAVFGGSAFLLVRNHFVRQRAYWVTFSTLNESRCMNGSLDAKDLGGIVMDEPLLQNPLMERTFWIDRSATSIGYVYNWGTYFIWNVRKGNDRLVTHPSLAHAGGLDVTDSRLFWTDLSTGQIWTADKETGSDIRQLPGVTGGRSLRLIQPFLRPTIAPVCEENRSGCSHFCQRYIKGFSSEPVEAKCFCPDGMQLGEDEKTCEDVEANAGQGSDDYPGCVAWP